MAAAESAAAADAESAQLEELVVTARRREENLQSVPVSVTALSANVIARNNIANIADVSKLTPSLVFDKYFSPQDTRPTIRGLPSSRGRPPVGILIDGIDVSTESLLTAGGGNLMDLRLLDFERIEVVKGPQSALYGRAAFGGAVNYVTKEPGSEFGGHISADVATDDRYEVRGGVDLPVNEDLTVRLNGMYSYFDGFYKNTVTGNTIGGYDAAGAAIAVKWQPSDKVKLVGRVSYVDAQSEIPATVYYGLENGLAVAMPLPASAAGQVIGTSRLPLAMTGYRYGPIDWEGKMSPTISADPADPTGQTDYPGAKTKTWIASLRGEFDLGFAQLSTWTGVTRQKGTTVSDVDFYGRPLTPVALPTPGGVGEFSGRTLGNGFWQFDISTDLEQFSQEVRIGDLDGGPFRWAVGALYWYENVDQLDRRITTHGIGANASAWLSVAQWGGRSPLAPEMGRETKHWSGYAIVEYDITDQLEVSLEGRYAQEKLNYRFAPSVALSSASPTLGRVPFILTGAYQQASSTTTYFTPRAIVSYQMTPDVMFYASVARGIKPGGFTQAGVADPSYGKYNPEKLWSYEVGAKTTLFDNRLRLNASLFNMIYKGKQVTTLTPVPLSISPQGFINVPQNIGEAEVKGLELEFTAAITPELTITGNYTHLAPEYTDFVYDTTAALIIARAKNCTVVTTSTGSTTCRVTQTGKDLEAAARDVAQLTVNYERDLESGWRLIAETSVQYRSKRYLEDTNSWSFHPYATVDAKLGVENERWAVTAYVNNLFEDETIKSGISVNDVISGVVGQQIVVGYLPDPRQFGVRVRYNF